MYFLGMSNLCNKDISYFKCKDISNSCNCVDELFI